MQVIILDEPTAGLDPEARRGTWNMLKEFRKGRTIILITHYMDEVDFLADRVVTMVNGRVETCGTPLFLKKTYGKRHNIIYFF